MLTVGCVTDHGLYRDIPKEVRCNYAKLWLAVIDGDEESMRLYSRKVAGITDQQFPLFASAITGRDYLTATKSVVSARSQQEKEVISGAMGEGLLQQLIHLLGHVPRIILLILKTNDLTRSLDENLHTRHGPVRNFMILAHYCSKTVFKDRVDSIKRHGSLLYPPNMLQFVLAWASFIRMEAKITLYEWYTSIQKRGFFPTTTARSS